VLLDDLSVEASPLVHALLTFTRLKDAVAMMRGFLTGMLAMPEPALREIYSRAVAELVFILHRQWEYVSTLQAKTPRELLASLSAALQLKSDLLAEVQSRLVSNFDLTAVRTILSVQKCWELYTAQVDGLQVVEVQLEARVRTEIAEAETQRVEAGRALGDAALAIAAADGAGAMGVARRLASMPSAVLKSVLLARLAELGPGEAALRSGALLADDGALGEREEPAPASPSHGAGAARWRVGERANWREQWRSSPMPWRSWQAGHQAGPADGLPEGFKISLDELKLKQRVGAGAAGATYRASWRGATVAVKVATNGRSGVAGWRAEVAALMQLRHPNVVRCWGVVAADPMLGIVLEYCAGGDVRHALKGATPPRFLWRVADGVAAGMAYMHGMGMLHRDLKSANCLLDLGGGAKISDFGLAKFEDEATTDNLGTFRWMAPEVARREGCSRASDVYSFSMLLYELVTHEVPFEDLTAELAAAVVAQNGARPLLPAGTPKALADVLRLCWSSEPERRPNFADVVKLLQRARSKMGEAELAWLDAPLGHRPKPREGAKRRPSGDARQTPRGGEARPSARWSEASMDT